MFEDCCAQVTEQIPEWVRETAAEFEKASTLEELIDIGQLFYVCGKVFPRYCSNLVRPFRERAIELHGKEFEKVVLVDLSSIFHAVFARGNAVADTRDRLADLYKLFGAKKFIVVTDSRNSNRRNLWPGYKAERPPKAPGFEDQYQQVIYYLKDKGVQVEEHDGWESDDIMASASYRAKLVDAPCFLVTNDKDLWQCLGGRVSIYDPFATEYRNADWLMANHSITPSQVVDWLCLVGKNDVPDADGIGASVASKLLKAYGDFVGVWESRALLTDHKRKIIEDFAEHYWLARDMHILRRDLPVRIW